MTVEESLLKITEELINIAKEERKDAVIRTINLINTEIEERIEKLEEVWNPFNIGYKQALDELSDYIDGCIEDAKKATS